MCKRVNHVHHVHHLSVNGGLTLHVLCPVRNCMYSGHLSALTPGFPMVFTCLPAALFALMHDTFIQLPQCMKVYQYHMTRAPQEICSRMKNTNYNYYIIVKLISYKIQSCKIIHIQIRKIYESRWSRCPALRSGNGA